MPDAGIDPRAATATRPERVNVLGVGVSAVSIPSALATFGEWIATRSRRYVCVTGVHGIMESQWDPTLRRIHNAAGMVTPDGMPLVWLCHSAGRREVTRVYGPDLMLAACSWSIPKGVRHFFYGGAPGVAEQLARSLQERFPGLDVCGTYTPPFRALSDDEEADVIAVINDARPDIVWVGLSTPKQERWMAAFRSRLEAPILVGVGAAFDFHAGTKAHAPRIMQRSGLEWLFRLVTEPRRLWPRYRRIIPAFLWGIFLQKSGLARYPLD